MLIYCVLVEINEDETETDLVIDLPVSNSMLHVIPSPNLQYLRLYSDDENVQKTLRPDEDGKYQVENLPAGHYHLTNGMFINKQPALQSFDLIAGETKTVDISQLITDSVAMSALQVEIVDENGSPVSDCNIWLEGDKGKIDPTTQYGFQTAFVTLAGNYTIHTDRTGYEDINRPVILEAVDITEGNSQKPQKLLLRLELIKH